MLLFRSDEHLQRWIEQGHPAGEALSVAQLWALARQWFAGRHTADWRPRTPEEAHEVFNSVGLRSDFWRFDTEPDESG
jgi:hypothetical protein